MNHDKGEALTRLFLEAFPFHGALMTAGERLTAPIGLTSARWQVLSAIARADTHQTVSQVSREMGLARQSVQRVASDLETLGFITFEKNPHHKRAFLMVLTNTGLQAIEDMNRRQAPWVNALSYDIEADDIETALRVLQKIRHALNQKTGEPKA